ncbi:3-deoxy-D-manno-octulosonic acid transferase [Paracoccus sp. PAR01]|uniref:3-deoxy-D-manno-octulosonic acid transferase n=1 Tax=Paracoccus sp. PAR01 TaxID=2769282 RepID=UPI001780C5E4|nr:glycosyltransferase N-terminal domain-containing protein [Paracoccus sp. PAR01]MBD9526291.1 3-deoxy-D-manno-octulosonic acid transferase [Paracoccus sp. PAR01]
MPPPGQVGSSLALWLHLRRRSALGPGGAAPPEAPPGSGTLILVHLSERADEPLPIQGVVKALLVRRPGLRLAFTGAPLPEDALPAGVKSTHLGQPRDPAAVRDIIDRLKPQALLLIGGQLPSALITGMAEDRLPVVLAEARLTDYERRGLWRGMVNRGLMQRLSRVLVPDMAAGATARQLGAAPERIEMTGPVTETLPPLHANEAERAALAQILRGRHVWLAAAPTFPEIKAALRAHHLALQHNHRALLILAALPEDLVPAIRAEAETLGLASVLRSEDEDPMADDHVLIADDPYEMGLWYRLAPVTFMGGTLFPGPGLAPRHPFEPAALGSAIIHGPMPGTHAAEWVQLGGASAARQVSDAETLSRAVSDLTAPDQAAILAGNAWSVSTGGAAVIRRIADAVIDAMEEAD